MLESICHVVSGRSRVSYSSRELKAILEGLCFGRDSLLRYGSVYFLLEYRSKCAGHRLQDLRHRN